MQVTERTKPNQALEPPAQAPRIAPTHPPRQPAPWLISQPGCYTAYPVERENLRANHQLSQLGYMTFWRTSHSEQRC